jgi:hypothetical protein
MQGLFKKTLSGFKAKKALPRPRLLKEALCALFSPPQFYYS